MNYSNELSLLEEKFREIGKLSEYDLQRIGEIRDFASKNKELGIEFKNLFNKANELLRSYFTKKLELHKLDMRSKEIVTDDDIKEKAYLRYTLRNLERYERLDELFSDAEKFATKLNEIGDRLVSLLIYM